MQERGEEKQKMRPGRLSRMLGLTGEVILVRGIIHGCWRWVAQNVRV